MINEPKKKLLIVNDLFNSEGGVEVLIHQFIGAWKGRYDISVLGFDLSSLSKADLPNSINRYYQKNLVPGSPIRKLSGKGQLRDSISAFLSKNVALNEANTSGDEAAPFSFDVVLAMKEGPITRTATGISGKKHLGWVHTDYKANYWTKAYYDGCREKELDAMAAFDNIICVSEQVRNSIVATSGDPGNLLVRYNPIPVDEIQKKANLPLAEGESKSEPGVIRFVMVGRIHEQKGYDLLIEAAKLLKEKASPDLPLFEILIIGGDSTGGKYLREMEKLKEKYSIDNIEFLGPRDNPYPLLASADWFLSTSRYEGYSISSQEAAVLGVPLILTDCAGAKELIGDSEYGILVDKDPSSIAEALNRVLSDPKLREHYGKRIITRSQIINFDQRLADIEALF